MLNKYARALFTRIFTPVARLLLSLGVMLYLSPLLAIVALVVAPPLLIVSYRMRWRVFPATWDGQQREGDPVGGRAVLQERQARPDGGGQSFPVRRRRQ